MTGFLRSVKNKCLQISNFSSFEGLEKLKEFCVVLFIIFSGFFVTAIFKLNNFYTFPSLDEMLWHLRSRVFWDKIFTSNLSGLVQSSQPGITVYWFTGFLMKFIDFDFTDVTRRIAEKEAEGLNFNYVVNANDPVIYEIYKPISFAFNVPLLILTVIFFVSFYYLLKKLKFGRVVASFSLLFLVTNVFLFYWNTPSDKMLNIFMTLSFLTLLVYLDGVRKEEKALAKNSASKKYLILSAILGSWAVLSKLSALFILPFYFFVFVFYHLPTDKKKARLIAKDYLIWIGVFVLVSVIFLPTIITHPQEVYELIFKPKNIIEENYQPTSYFHRFFFDYLQLFSFVIIGYMAQGSSLSLVAYFVLRFKKKYKNLFDCFPRRHVKVIGAYILLFVAMVSLISKNHDIRFMSPALVMMSVFSAMGLYGVVEVIMKKADLKSELRNHFYATIALVIIFAQVIFIVSNGALMDKALEIYLK